jgi:hypothetical protein
MRPKLSPEERKARHKEHQRRWKDANPEKANAVSRDYTEALGLMRDSPERLQAAASYLESFVAPALKEVA